MSVRTEYQIINHNGKPAYVLVPIDEFEKIRPIIERDRIKTNIPQAVVEAHILHGTNIVKAWREHLGLTQSQVADGANMQQAAIARIESGNITPRRPTLLRIALAMGLSVEQLDV